MSLASAPGLELEVVNPLVTTLGHFEQRLVALLPAGSRVRITRVGIEATEGSFAWRLRRQLALRLTAARRTEPLLVLWPAFGLLDPLSWWFAARKRRVLVLLHDAEPLRRQHGFGRLPRRLLHLTCRFGVDVVALSEPAADALRAQGWAPLRMPYPVAQPASVSQSQGRANDAVLVLGQYKPARSLAVLDELGHASELDGRRHVVGRGWPPVPGWDVRNEFLSDDCFAEVLSQARCLVLPYSRYFQSDVAVRALESGVPVVADRHPFLVDLLGSGWPGFVDVDGWAAAVNRAAAVPPTQMRRLVVAAHERSTDAWRSELSLRRTARIAG